MIRNRSNHNVYGVFLMVFLFADFTLFRLLTFIGAVLAFALTFILTKALMGKLPTDIGRAFAVNAAAAKGKPRGAGIIFVLVFVGCVLIFAPLSLENTTYCVLLVLAMLAGYLDDASRAPWGEYKKGLIDLGISLLITVVYVITNGTEMVLVYSGKVVELPMWLYIILGTVLVWASVNVTNCTDGVDGLSSTLSLISLGGFVVLSDKLAAKGFAAAGMADGFTAWIIMFMAVIAAYLMFNASPSILLMGDAGSRTIGVFFALAAMKTGAPLMFLALCLVFILDGGLGIIKVSMIRFLKLKNFMKDIRTPLHDHVRKNKGWSDTQTVIRFALIHLVIIFLALWFI